MARTTLILAVAVVLVSISGCSLSMMSNRDQAWRRDAEAICLGKGGYTPTAYAQRISRIDDRGACGIWYPLKVTAGLNGYLPFSQPATLNCPLTSALDGWLYHVVQPAAANYFGAYVGELKVIGSYACRTRNSRPGAKISEHAFGNAIDVAGFTLTDGREITVLEGWRADPWQAAFLREVHKGACGIFTTVIGPDGDGYHRDHFHLDLARHNEDGTYRYCE